jgi:Predicted nucleotide-binding protein containing TIR-like domain
MTTMTEGADVFAEINSAVLDLQAAGPQNFQRPLRRIAQLLHDPDLEPDHQELASKADLDAFLSVSHTTGGSMVGSKTLQWPDDANLQLGLFLRLMDVFATDPDQAIGFGYEFFHSGNGTIAGVHVMTRDLIIPFTREFKRYVLSRGKPAERLVVPGSNKVFIVHGHDEAALHGLARFLEKLGLKAIVLAEQPNKGRTVIEKFEGSAGEVGFAVVLMTPDDVGGAAGQDQSMRARQNVLFELGYFSGKLGRGRVCLLRKGAVEVPSGLFGVIYTDMDEAGAWREKLVHELKAAKLDFDPNRLWG